MKPLLQQNPEELARTLLWLCEPAERLCRDERLVRLLRDWRAGRPDPQALIACLTAGHAEDLKRVASAVCGASPAELNRRSGAEVLALLCRAWKEELGPFFRRCASTEPMR